MIISVKNGDCSLMQLRYNKKVFFFIQKLISISPSFSFYSKERII